MTSLRANAVMNSSKFGVGRRGKDTAEVRIHTGAANLRALVLGGKGS
jgi:hypothetical protein